MFFFKRKNKPVQAEQAAPDSQSPHIDVLQSGKQHQKLPSVSFSGSVVSTVGCVRTNNEDNYILDGHMNDYSSDHSKVSVSGSDTIGSWHFAGVFDVMGVGDKGEIAAQTTARIFLKATSLINDSSSKSNVDLILRNAFLEANNAIVALRRECNVFGTTGTVLYTNMEEFKIFHLGDSRAYLIRKGDLFQLTYDQTLAQLKVEAGLYSEDDPRAEADKHKLTEFIGKDSTCEHIQPLESQWIAIQKDDRILLCSDGLYSMCSDAEMMQILRQADKIDILVQKLADAACHNGGEDNVTCVIVEIS